MNHTFPPYAGDPAGRSETVSVAVLAQAGGRRQFTLTSTQPQRDGGTQQRVVDEAATGPRVHSPSPLFDALFAMALDDARLNSVDEIRDAAYNGGRAIACRCFQTGESWHYVWTRDIAYATHLGLAWLDPDRAATSLLFKTSDWREGVGAVDGVPAGTTQIVQDTGSGGSWPVSTDRVSWAWGAQGVLDILGGDERARFAARALAALRGTIEADRLAAFHAEAGLYGGEQSFLDWRVQSYAPWITDHLARMAGYHALSTNVSHYQALRLAAALSAAAGEPALASRYAAWAESLRAAINRVFWLEDVQQYASLASDDPSPVALHKFDLLGTALAVISGVAPPQRAAQALARYPHAPFGAPVIAPQQPGVPVYHNRAIWPFVTAYELRAAARVGNAAVAGHAFDSLFRAAALNLSNMENLEWLTAKPRFDDGPVINSRRQLWSVAGYLSAVAESVFGFRPEASGMRIAPFLTVAARRALGPGAQASLSGLRWQGRHIDIELALPPLPTSAQDAAFYPVQHLRLNGREIDGVIAAADLAEGVNHIEIRFAAAAQSGDARIAQVPTVDPRSHDDPRVFAPDVPLRPAVAREQADIVVRFVAPKAAGGLRYNLYRDGQLAVAGWRSEAWTDASASPGIAHAYTIEAVDARSGHRSHLSEPVRLDDAGVQALPVGAWFERQQAGRVGLVLRYDNHAFETQTGVTNAVKLLRVLDGHDREVARGIVQMPHVEPQDGRFPRRLSTMVRADLPAGRFRVELLDFFNMSYLQSNASYGGPGGVGGALNSADVDLMKVLSLPDAR